MNVYQQIWATTTHFKPEPGEEAQTNRGRYGRAFANWIGESISNRGETVQDVVAEDWGWCVLIGGTPYKLWIGCGNRAGSTTDWGAFVAAETTLVQRFVQRIDTKPSIERLQKTLHELMQEIPGVIKVWVE